MCVVVLLKGLTPMPPPPGLGFRVWGLGFRVEGLGFRVLGWGLGSGASC